MDGAVVMNPVDTALKAFQKTLSSTELMKRRERGWKHDASLKHRLDTDPALLSNFANGVRILRRNKQKIHSSTNKSEVTFSIRRGFIGIQRSLTTRHQWETRREAVRWTKRCQTAAFTKTVLVHRLRNQTYRQSRTSLTSTTPVTE
jgi:hypothetical protein